jgi:hypothetical protein
MEDQFEHHIGGLNAPAFSASEIDLSGGDVELCCTRALFVGTGGDVHVEMKDGSEVTFRNVVGGCERPWRIRKVFQVGTNAADLVALW